MGKTRIMFDNILRNAGMVITASAEDAGFPASNLATWRVYNKWSASGDNEYIFEFESPTALDVNALVISGHNLFTCGARFKLDGYDEVDSSATTDTPLITYVTPTDNKTIRRYLTGTASYKGYRLTINNNGGANFTPEIGIVFLGEYLEIPRNPSLPINPDSQEDKNTLERGGTGQALGVVETFALRDFAFNYDNLDPSFVSSYWKPFYDNFRSNPFFINWDSASAEVWLAT